MHQSNLLCLAELDRAFLVGVDEVLCCFASKRDESFGSLWSDPAPKDIPSSGF